MLECLTYNRSKAGCSAAGSAPEWDSINNLKTLSKTLIAKFLSSRRQGLSPRTLEFYQDRLTRAAGIIGLHIQAHHINNFFGNLHCGNGNKHAYWRALTVFYHWLYSPKSGYGLNPQDNPILNIDSPKREQLIMPSLTEIQAEYLISKADNLRDKCIVVLLFDSGMRLTELTNIKHYDINWDSYTVTIVGKGNKQRKAPFTQRSANLLQEWLINCNTDGNNIWGMNKWGIQTMLKRLRKDTGIKCNPHSFRRGFACNLHRKGLSTIDIMHLGGWEDLSMVLRYTKSITFDDCLKHYRELESRQ